jgi:hypothetical protein
MLTQKKSRVLRLTFRLVSSDDQLPVTIIAIYITFSVLALISAILAYKYYFQPMLKERRRRARNEEESCESIAFEENSESVMSDGILSPMNAMPTHMKALFGSKRLESTFREQKVAYNREDQQRWIWCRLQGSFRRKRGCCEANYCP